MKTIQGALSSKKNRTELVRALATTKKDRCTHKMIGLWRS